MKSLILALCAVVGLGSVADAGEGRVQVSGSGTASGRPDKATVSLSVVRENSVLAKAVAATSADVKVIVDLLQADKADGAVIEKKNITTQNYQVQPVYVDHDNKDSTPPRLSHYQVSQHITFSYRCPTGTFERLSVLMSDLLEEKSVLIPVQGNALGAPTVSLVTALHGVDFSIENTDALMEAARKSAVKEAITKAQTLTNSAGVKLGSVVLMTENSSGRSYDNMSYELRSMDDAPGGSSVTLPSGNQTVTANVNMTFEIE